MNALMFLFAAGIFYILRMNELAVVALLFSLISTIRLS